jgi:hypothetical protein
MTINGILYVYSSIKYIIMLPIIMPSKYLFCLFPILRIKENVPFHGANNLPILLTNEERINEIKLAVKRINNLLDN